MKAGRSARSSISNRERPRAVGETRRLADHAQFIVSDECSDGSQKNRAGQPAIICAHRYDRKTDPRIPMRPPNTLHSPDAAV